MLDSSVRPFTFALLLNYGSRSDTDRERAGESVASVSAPLDSQLAYTRVWEGEVERRLGCGSSR